MNRRLAYLPSADFDLEAIYDLIAQDSPCAALAFVEDVRQRCEALAQFPHMGRTHDGQIYQFTFDRRARVNDAVLDDEAQLSQFRYLGQL